MAVNQIYKYVWLVRTIYHAQRISFERLNAKWLEEDISGGVELSRRTFHKWRVAVEDIFGLVIDNEQKGEYRYFILNADELVKDTLNRWIIDTLSVSQLLQTYRELKPHILVEDIPSGQTYLKQILEAMRKSRMMKLTYRSFRKEQSHTFDVEPYCIKLFRQRWYLVARSTYYDKVMVYAFDRIGDLRMSNSRTFQMPETFSPDVYFDGCYGVIADKNIPIERITLKVYGRQVDYFRTLPLHESQREIETAEDFSIFEYQLRPTYDFQKDILSYGANIEVLSPMQLRHELTEKIKKTYERYL